MNRNSMVLIALLCACTQERYVLLPDETGRTGNLVVSPRGEQPITLNAPYAGVRTGALGVREEGLTPDRVREEFGRSLDAMPMPPRRFTLYFLEGSDQLTSESRAEVAEIFAEIGRRPAPGIRVVGHTDRIGSVEDNDRLGLLRAQKVEAELIRLLGLDEVSISVSSRGEREPLFPTADEVPEPRNRRVEIFVQ